MSINNISFDNLTSGTVNFSGVITSNTNRWKFCANCGKQLEESWKHCPECGTQIGVIAAFPYQVIASPPYWQWYTTSSSDPKYWDTGSSYIIPGVPTS